MAKIALAVGGAVAGALIPGLQGLGVMAIISAASEGLAVGSALGSLLFRPHVQAPLQSLQVSSSAEGAPIPFGYGTCRFAGQMIWCPGIHYTTQTSKGGPSQTSFTYYANFAIAFGEGPLTITRMWGDSKIIYSALGGDQSDFPVGDYPPWDSTITYNPGNQVSYLGQVFQCVTSNSNHVPNTIIPSSGTIYWEVLSSYPPWQSGISYQQGQTVSYEGGIFVAKTSAPGGPPGSGNWESITQYYGTPTIYPGDENQGIDPDIQASETSAYTPAFRGLGLVKWMNFPLLNFGNRIPNLRAEVTFQKVLNVL